MSALTWQQCDKVPLEHRLEIGVDLTVLIVAHARQQVLHEVHLARLAPLGEVLKTEFPLRLVRGRGVFLAHWVVQHSGCELYG